MAKPEWGTKRICHSCGARFYDLHRDPIICPKCSTEFDPEAVLKSRRNRVLPADTEPEKPEVEEAEEEQDAADDSDDGDDGVDDSDDDLIEDADDLEDDDVSEIVDVDDEEDKST